MQRFDNQMLGISLILSMYQNNMLGILFYLIVLACILLILGQKLSCTMYRLQKDKNIYIDKSFYDWIRAKENDSAHPNQNCIA